MHTLEKADNDPNSTKAKIDKVGRGEGEGGEGRERGWRREGVSEKGQREKGGLSEGGVEGGRRSPQTGDQVQTGDQCNFRVSQGCPESRVSWDTLEYPGTL